MILLNASALNSFLQLMGAIVIFAFVLVITYFTTKWIGNYQQVHTTNKNLRVIESLRLTNNKFIQIVQAGDVYLVIAVGKEEVQLLTQLTKEQLTELPDFTKTQNTLSQESFQDILSKVKKHIPKK
ncbi:MAG: flagellar biosynthetic protein FliO [Roseburia sp.]|uniref:flagellar biosynthetic protein FliO n=1 Tax=Roseburia sp. 831b TaxID=1261635 RepID=UPI0009FA9C06|nr:flagellar biosynthetic protein FliO [Roseburia sp. 831b]MCI5918563.1 flagellar biosynthetic protein FliO [Roseburia sp.]MDY5883236.1 flagellar biosynthetic protein FliO [Roseburia sp.]WVK73855.1 flagellar biosynthetic protein FliO [Roseburia sp. 831b]